MQHVYTYLTAPLVFREVEWGHRSNRLPPCVRLLYRGTIAPTKLRPLVPTRLTPRLTVRRVPLPAETLGTRTLRATFPAVSRCVSPACVLVVPLTVALSTSRFLLGVRTRTLREVTVKL